MADLLKKEFGEDSKLEPGGTGEFTVWLDGEKMAEKTLDGFPTDEEILKRIRSVGTFS